MIQLLIKCEEYVLSNLQSAIVVLGMLKLGKTKNLFDDATLKDIIEVAKEIRKYKSKKG